MEAARAREKTVLHTDVREAQAARRRERGRRRADVKEAENIQ